MYLYFDLEGWLPWCTKCRKTLATPRISGPRASWRPARSRSRRRWRRTSSTTAPSATTRTAWRPRRPRARRSRRPSTRFPPSPRRPRPSTPPSRPMARRRPALIPPWRRRFCSRPMTHPRSVAFLTYGFYMTKERDNLVHTSRREATILTPC